MNLFIKYIYALCGGIAIAASVTACSLEEEVYSEITESTYKYEPGDATKVIGSSYANLRGLVGFYTYYLQEICTDETVQPANQAGWDDGGIFRRMHLHSWNTNQGHVNDYWDCCYTGALLANRALELISQDNFPFSSTENKASLVAETRVLRAYYYWLILDNWGDAPLVTVSTPEQPMATSRADIYTFVVKELTECIEGALPDRKETSNYGRFNKWNAKALLANIYLNAEVYTGTPQWNACIQECDDILNCGQYQLESDYLAPFKIYNENSVENLFVIPFDAIYAPGFEIYKAILHAANQATYRLQDSPWGPGSYKAVPQFINTYDPDDERLSMSWIQGLQYAADGTALEGSYDMMGKPLEFVNSMPDGIFTGEADGFRLQKYEIQPEGKTFMNNDFVIFRLAQVYMMKAECLLRIGNADAAAQLVTAVRQRAFKNHPEKAEVTGENLKEPSRYAYGTIVDYVFFPQGKSYPEQFGRMYDELGWEFAGETIRRRDMIRFGHFTKAEWLSHKPNGDFRALFPIPQAAIDANRNLKQNPAYE